MSRLQRPFIADYELLRPIGRGAFGKVWLARSVTGQFRAVKILERSCLPSQRAFDREFEGVLRYEPVSRTHPNLVQVLHVGRAPDGECFWYVMELADDARAKRQAPNTDREPLPDTFIENYEPRTLRSLLCDNGRLPISECLPIAIGLAEAVVHLHAQGLVHRDVKPSNVILVGGRPKLADIGLVTGSQEQPSFVGTAGYIPPDGPGTPHADIYALGKVLYEMSTGRPVQDFPRLPEDFLATVSPKESVEFNEVVLRAADIDPRRRFPSAKELCSDLLLLQAGRSVRRWRGVERRLRLASRVGVVGAGIAAISLVLGAWANHERLHAVKAEQELATRFVQQQLSLARAVRLTGLPGQRTQALELIHEAARKTNSLALRNEAIATLALPDVSHSKTIKGAQMVFDRLIRRYATNDPNGNITIRSVEDDDRLAYLSVGCGSESSPVAAGLLGFDFSAAGEYFCASYSNRQFLIWRTGSMAAENEGCKPGSPTGETPESIVPRTISLAFEPRSQLIVPGGELAGVEDASGTLHFFDLQRGCAVGPTIPGSFQSHGIAFCADGTRFAILNEDVLGIHDFATGELRQAFTNRTGFLGLVWHPDGHQIATWSGERALRLWNLTTGNPSGVLRAHEAEVVSAAFDASGQWMVSASWDNQTVLWNMAQQKEVLRWSGSGNGLRFSADARRVAWHTWNDQQWQLFELTSPTELVRLEQHPGLETTAGLRSLWGITFLDSHLIAGAGDTGFCVWQPPIGYASVLATIGLERPLFCVGTGRQLLSTGSQGMRNWPIAVEPGRAVHIGPPQRLSPARLSTIVDFTVSSNGLRVALVNTSRQLFLRTERDPLAWQELASKDVYTLSIEPTGRFVAATFMGGGVRVWNAENSSIMADLPCGLGLSCHVSPDGRWLAVASPEEFLIWRVADWRLAHRVPRTAVSGPVQGWSADGEILGVHDRDSTLRLLRAGTWEELGAVPSPKLLKQVCFSPDGAYMALASEKSGVEMWNLRQLRQQLARLDLDWGGSLPPPIDCLSLPWKIRVDAGL